MELVAKVDLKSTHPGQFKNCSNVIRSFGRVLRGIYGMGVVQFVLDATVRDTCSWLAQMYRESFRLAQPLGDGSLQKKSIGELKMAVEKGDDRERTVATMTLLELCGAPIIRAELREIKLLDVFIRQLRQKNNALLAAYALVSCLKYGDMKEYVMDNKDWPTCIATMLEKDLFDGALGEVEGFHIFEDFMRDADLREKIMKCDIIHALETKLAKGEASGNRTGPIFVDIVQTYDHSCVNRLVSVGLGHLKSPQTRKTGVAILSALAQTNQGMAAVHLCTLEIIEMLLPEDYRPLRPTCPLTVAGSFTPPTITEIQTESTDPHSSLRLTGPVHALRILMRNESLRNHVCKTHEYNHLKELYYESGTFSKTGKWPWQKWDGTKVLDEIFKAVDRSNQQTLWRTILAKNTE